MTCPTCGFDAVLWTLGDLRTTRSDVDALARQVLAGAPRELQPDVVRVLAALADLPAEHTVATLHRAMHVLHDAGRRVHEGRTAGRATVVALNRSGGGVPKAPTDRVRVRPNGFDGDQQQNRRHHGRPWQAVCLWSAEIIEGLQAEGHPIGFGSAGENLTLRGLDWTTLTPGLRLQVGAVVVQISSYAIPCVKNARWFADGDISRMAQEVRPGASRLYASVVVPGVIAHGDAVLLEPTVVPVAVPTQLVLETLDDRVS